MTWTMPLPASPFVAHRRVALPANTAVKTEACESALRAILQRALPRTLGRNMNARLTYQGSCHCGRVSFELDAKLDYVMHCSCSLCRRVGALWHGASESSLRITAGEDELTLYQFNTLTAKHYYCKHCGIHPFSRPRLDPSRVPRLSVFNIVLRRPPWWPWKHAG